jgi:hypothetical protein
MNSELCRIDKSIDLFRKRCRYQISCNKYHFKWFFNLYGLCLINLIVY